MLAGFVEIQASDGKSKTFGPGDIVLVEGITGKGHKSRSPDGKPRRSSFLPLPWRPKTRCSFRHHGAMVASGSCRRAAGSDRQEPTGLLVIQLSMGSLFCMARHTSSNLMGMCVRSAPTAA